LAKKIIPETDKFKRMSRDLFLFSFWANGINFADLIRLKWSDYNLKNKEFTFIREKTKRTATEEILISFPLFESMHKIIMEWGNDDQGVDGLVFPFLNSSKTQEDEIRVKKNLTSMVNHSLKSIVKEINNDMPFDEKLFEGISTYTARHSYATILAHYRVPESYIGFSLGHSRKSVTDSYIEAYSVEDRRIYNKLLQFE
jgi:integrase